jgi:hypothetical protein
MPRLRGHDRETMIEAKIITPQNPFGKSFARLARMRSSSALLERAMTGKVFLRRNNFDAATMIAIYWAGRPLTRS